VDTYFGLSNDPDRSMLLPLYVCHWAVVLAQVAGHQRKNVDSASERAALTKKSKKLIGIEKKTVRESFGQET
jgi:aminoglycoside phosphotransferase family enzyme